MMYKIGIVGYGYVGKGMAKIFDDDVTAIYDPDAGKTDQQSFKDIDLAIICVPTGMKENGQCDTSAVDSSLEWLNDQGVKLVLIKSTVEPGTTDRLQKKYPDMEILFSPEYIGESNYFTPPWLYPDPEDAKSHGFMVIGGTKSGCEKVTNIFIRKMGPHTKFIYLEAKESEFVKYWENIWGAMKVTFTNQMADYAKALGVNFYRAREGWLADPRIERMHTAVFEKARGFSGKCYPKDLSAFIYSVEKGGGDTTLLKTIWNINCDYRPDEFEKK